MQSQKENNSIKLEENSNTNEIKFMDYLIPKITI